MSGICLAAGAAVAVLAGPSFTLAWTHSIEKIRWEEDWRSEDRHLVITEARVRGSGAGMEPPAGAVLRDGIWHYRPPLPPQEKLRLTHSPYAADYELCTDGSCVSLDAVLPGIGATAVIEVSACDR